MKILLNEKEFITDIKSIYDLKNEVKKDADIMILNGFPVSKDETINEGDQVSFIKRGEIPSRDELEGLLVSRHTPKVYKALKKGRVAIAGLGGLGSNVALSLARVGIGYIKLIDFDVVEPSNLNRQQYFVSHIGMKKTEALKEILTQVNPFINLEIVDTKVTTDNINELFNDVDIILECFDKADCKAMIVNEVLQKFKDKKIISSSGMAGFYSNNIIKTKKINSRLYICGDFVNEARKGNGLMAPRVAIAANHEANTVVRLLLNEEDV